MTFDYLADLIYLIDLLFFKPRVMYLSDGFWIKDRKLTRVMYFHKIQFKVKMTLRYVYSFFLKNLNEFFAFTDGRFVSYALGFTVL